MSEPEGDADGIAVDAAVGPRVTEGSAEHPASTTTASANAPVPAPALENDFDRVMTTSL
ncbi:hypothetical protein [Herbiconiux sp. VKM Ac-1786]|uniref:hypothetical protein n=1 Tax=Herbiconiux sp. VKM Ac-1786 TaxID=2783824 RepID=UPI00351C2D26